MLPDPIALSGEVHPNWFIKLLLVFLSSIAALQILMVFRFQISWDEFFLLEWVYKWNRGELNLPLQTIYLRLFSWLPNTRGNEVTQIIAARAIMFICLSVTCGFIYGLCRKFTGVTTALLGLIFFLTMTFVFRNATSFRTDMIVTPLLMSVLWILVTHNLSWKRVVISGALLGLAGMVTIKAILYIPIVLGILFAHWGSSKWDVSIFLKSVALGLLAILSFGALYILQSLSLNVPESSTDYLAHSAKGSLLEAGLFPARSALFYGALMNPLFYIILLVGFVFSLLKIKEADQRWRYIAAISFIFPLLTIIFYRHAHPYFYSFMLAPATLLVAIGLNIPAFKKYTALLLGLVVMLFIHMASIAHKSFRQNLDPQKHVLATIHELFPTPTAYIDRCAMVSSYPKSGLFMSHWTMYDYHKAGEPIMDNILMTEQPKFILANIDSLDLDKIKDDTGRRLLTTDEEMLKQNYIPHWGPIYVAGKSLDTQANTSQTISIFIAGPYGIESAYPVNINGKPYQPGESVELSQGTQTISSPKPQNITLRWNSLTVPDTAPPTRKLFF